MLRFVFALSTSLLLCLTAPIAAQQAGDGVVDVPLAIPSQRSGVVPTNLLPMGALRIESGGVRLPGQAYEPPSPNGATVAMPFGRPADLNAPLTPSASPQAPPSPAGKSAPQPRKGAAQTAPPVKGACVGALDAALQVQLGAVDGEAAADREADRLMRRHGDLLGARPTPTDCSSNRKDLFRIRLAVPTPAEGQRLCSELAGRGERCIVVRGGQ